MATRSHFTSRFKAPLDAVSFEQQALSIGREFLPACAQVVLDGAEPTGEYWSWLCEQEAEASADWAAEKAFQEQNG